jgi:hypothetical protein
VADFLMLAWIGVFSFVCAKHGIPMWFALLLAVVIPITGTIFMVFVGWLVQQFLRSRRG